MMPRSCQNNGSSKLVWIYSGHISNALDAATWLDVTKGMRNLGWRVNLIAFGADGKYMVDGVEVYGFAVPDFYFIRHLIFHLRVILYILQNWKRIDIVLFHPMSAPWLLPLRFIRCLHGDKLPLFLMDTRDFNPTGGNIKNRIRFTYGNLVRYLANYWADGQTAITVRMANFLHIPDDHLLGTWPSGVSLELFTPAQVMRKWPMKGDCVRLIYIGALLRERNLLTMCQAVEEANAKGMNFHFSLFGEGAARADLEAFSRRANGRIDVFSQVPHEQIPVILAQAHVGVTSLFFTDEELYQASSPIKLFEYMAAGLPILAPRMPCHSDFIGNGKYVFWVDRVDLSALTEVLQLIWDSRSSLSKMGSLAATAASNWTWHASAMKLKIALEYGLGRVQ